MQYVACREAEDELSKNEQEARRILEVSTMLPSQHESGQNA